MEQNFGWGFLLCDDSDPHGNRIIVFATDANLLKLCAAERVFSDGTFYSCSTFFSQLYTLHAKVNGTVFPLYLDCCPTSPRTPTYMYVRFFELFKNAVHERQSVLTPEHWMLDFEVAAHNAVRTSFPQTSIKGCFFHYTQCIWRKKQSSGLV